MPIVSGNEPQAPPKKASTPGCGWILPLLIFGPSIYRYVRRAAVGRVTDQQLLIIVGGVLALVVMGLIIQRVSRARGSTTTSLPTMYTPPLPSKSSDVVARGALDQPFVPSAPRFEPMITGKVLLVGVVLAALMSGIGFVLLVLR